MTSTTPRRRGRPSAIAAVGLTGAPSTAAAAAAPSAPPPEPPARSARVKATADEEVIAYTLRLTESESLAADELTLTARRLAGRRLERSDLLRSLLGLAAEDPELLRRAVERAAPRSRS